MAQSYKKLCTSTHLPCNKHHKQKCIMPLPCPSSCDVVFKIFTHKTVGYLILLYIELIIKNKQIIKSSIHKEKK